MSSPDVKFYEVGSQYDGPLGSWSRVTGTIERWEQWAILHDCDDKRWDVWVEGNCKGRYHTQQKAEAVMLEYISGERDHGVAIKKWEERH